MLSFNHNYGIRILSFGVENRNHASFNHNYGIRILSFGVENRNHALLVVNNPQDIPGIVSFLNGSLRYLGDSWVHWSELLVLNILGCSRHKDLDVNLFLITRYLSEVDPEWCAAWDVCSKPMFGSMLVNHEFQLVQCDMTIWIIFRHIFAIDAHSHVLWWRHSAKLAVLTFDVIWLPERIGNWECSPKMTVALYCSRAYVYKV